MRALRRKPEQIFVPSGFAFAALSAGIKASGRPDVALARSIGSTAASVFTRNRVVAAPIEIGRASLKKTRGRLDAVLVNSGNANCATGAPGLVACASSCKALAALLGTSGAHIFPSSTGIIGVPLPSDKIIACLPALIASLRGTREAATQFADAILTTDTRRKIASRRLRVKGRTVTLLGIAKGSGMIHPQMATMLVYLFTDLSASPKELDSLLRDVADETFNRISVDGDTSTNDTVVLVASGESGVNVGGAREPFRQALFDVCQSLAEQIVTDGEGVKHVLELSVEQARRSDDALEIARAIAHSPLVKTAWAGSDPNWGRILAAIGRSGVPIDPNKVNIFIGDQRVCRNGSSFPFDVNRAHRALRKPQCEIRVQLGAGTSRVRFLTTDLTAEYVSINADYST